MSHHRAFLLSLIASMVWFGSADARHVTPRTLVPETLVELGIFDRSVPSPEGFGIDVQVYELDQTTGQQSLKDPNFLPRLCSDNIEVLTDNCVRTIQINIKPAKRYRRLFMQYTRAGVEHDELMFNGRRIGFTSGEEGHWAELGVDLGHLTRVGRTYRLRVSAPSPGEGGDGVHAMGGIRIVGMAKPTKHKHKHKKSDDDFFGKD